MSGAVPADPRQFADLHAIVARVASMAGIPKPRVYIINDAAPNAFATGRNERHAATAFTTGILTLLTPEELEGVVAHELSHIKNRDILVGTIAVVLAGFVAIIGDVFLRAQLFGGRSDENRSGLFAIIGIVAAILAPLAATLIQLSISRRREYLADASGALLTHKPANLASALGKLAAHHRPLAKASTATAHLFIANPFGNRRVSFAKLFATHPPLEDRIRLLLRQR